VAFRPRSSAGATAALLVPALFACAHAAGAPGVLLEDVRGYAAVRSQQPATIQSSWSRLLSEEEIALGSRLIVQVEVLPERPLPGVYSARVLHDFSAAGSASGVIAFYGAAYSLPAGSEPFALLFPTARPNTYAEQRIGSTGFVHEGTITFPRSDGTSESYPLANAANVFACLARSGDRVSAARCTTDRLGRYGIRTPQQRRIFENLKDEDPAAALLWLLVVRRDHHARFPTVRCRDARTTSGCASSRAFSRRSGIFPGS
jgi:hypothetical protein